MPVERPILGPVRCLCDVPLEPFRVIDGGVWGSLACRRCARLLLGTTQPAARSLTPERPADATEQQEQGG